MNLSVKLALTCFLLFLLLTQCLAADPKVQTWIDRASESAGEITDPEQQSIVNDPLARALARSGEVVNALAVAKGIADPLPKMYVLTAIAEAARKTGNKEVCQQAVDAAKQDALDNAGPFHTSAYIDLCFAAGMPDAAMEYADELFKSDRDSTHYQKLVEGFAASGDVAAAEKLLDAKQLGDYGKYYLVQGLTAAKKYDEAIQVAGSIGEQHPADRSHSHIATALAHEGQEEKALEQAAMVRDSLKRSVLQGEISLFSSKNDSVDQLRKRFAAANTRDMKTRLLNPLVWKLMEIDAFDEAEMAIDEAVKYVANDPRKTSASKFGVYGDDSELVFLRAAHLTIAKKLIEVGKKDEAAMQVAKIEPLYDALSEEAALIKWPLAPQLVAVLVQLGELERAKTKLEEIKTPFTRNQAAVPIAVHYIKAGDVEKGLELVTANDSKDEHHGSEYNDVALALLESVSVARAAEFLESLSETEGHGRAVRDTARELVESKRLDKLEELYAAVKSPFVRTLLATEAANRLLPEAE
jgi:tetratricopeptide (TPR) repeat protein